MADAQASGACGSNIVWVQVPSPAFYTAKTLNIGLSRFLFAKFAIEIIYRIPFHVTNIKILLFDKNYDIRILTKKEALLIFIQFKTYRIL